MKFLSVHLLLLFVVIGNEFLGCVDGQRFEFDTFERIEDKFDVIIDQLSEMLGTDSDSLRGLEQHGGLEQHPPPGNLQEWLGMIENKLDFIIDQLYEENRMTN